MRLSVLTDNSSLTDRYYLAEPGFSVLVEEGARKVLFDLGYSDVFLRNAMKMGQSLLDLEYVVLSHGHLDHTWGLVHLVKALTEAEIEKRDFRRPELVAHPDVFLTKQSGKVPESGALLSEEKCAEHFGLHLSREPFWLLDDLVFLGEIPRRFEFEPPEPGRKRRRNGDIEPDLMPDDSALAWKGEEGLVVITGCSHAGICNIVAYAREICNEERVQDIVGGFHMMKAPENRLDATAATLKGMGITRMHPCHCTGFRAVHRFAREFMVEEMGSGQVCEYS